MRWLYQLHINITRQHPHCTHVRRREPTYHLRQKMTGRLQAMMTESQAIGRAS